MTREHPLTSDRSAEVPWYVTWPKRLERDEYEMRRAFPALALRFVDGAAVWTGRLHTAEDGTPYHVAIVCPRSYPMESPRIYPTSVPVDEELHHECHIMADGSLCIA